MRIREIAEARVRYGYYRIYILLRREGWAVSHKRVYRLYQKEGLSLRRNVGRWILFPMLCMTGDDCGL